MGHSSTSIYTLVVNTELINAISLQLREVTNTNFMVRLKVSMQIESFTVASLEVPELELLQVLSFVLLVDNQNLWLGFVVLVV